MVCKTGGFVARAVSERLAVIHLSRPWRLIHLAVAAAGHRCSRCSKSNLDFSRSAHFKSGDGRQTATAGWLSKRGCLKHAQEVWLFPFARKLKLIANHATTRYAGTSGGGKGQSARPPGKRTVLRCAFA